MHDPCLVGRQEQHVRVRYKRVLGSVPVVDVKVDHEHPPQAVALLGVARRDRGVVYEAEAHRALRNLEKTA